MATRDKLRDLVARLEKKSAAKEVNWKPSTFEDNPAFIVELPQSKVVVDKVSPMTEPDFIRVRFARKDGLVAAEWSAEEGENDWSLASSLYGEASRTANHWDEVLQDVEQSIGASGVIGDAKAIDASSVQDANTEGKPTSASEQQEIQRQNSILQRLRKHYIMTHNGLSPGMLSGREPLPKEWVERELTKMGEKWRRAHYS